MLGCLKEAGLGGCALVRKHWRSEYSRPFKISFRCRIGTLRRLSSTRKPSPRTVGGLCCSRPYPFIKIHIWFFPVPERLRHLMAVVTPKDCWGFEPCFGSLRDPLSPAWPGLYPPFSSYQIPPLNDLRSRYSGWAFGRRFVTLFSQKLLLVFSSGDLFIATVHLFFFYCIMVFHLPVNTFHGTISLYSLSCSHDVVHVCIWDIGSQGNILLMTAGLCGFYPYRPECNYL